MYSITINQLLLSYPTEFVGMHPLFYTPVGRFHKVLSFLLLEDCLGLAVQLWE